jgi:hypothetical protein
VSGIYFDQKKPSSGLVVFKLNLGEAFVPARLEYGCRWARDFCNFARLNSASGAEQGWILPQFSSREVALNFAVPVDVTTVDNNILIDA